MRFSLVAAASRGRRSCSLSISVVQRHWLASLLDARTKESTILESNPMHTSPHEAALLRALHIARDREESERTRFLGALVAHDLNNALFALSGRLQLLKRRSTDPAILKSVDELLASTRLFDEMLSLLHKACPRDLDHHGPSAVRTAWAEALRRVEATYPGIIDAESAKPDALPADLAFDGTQSMIASAFAQCVAIYRNRGAPRIFIQLNATRDGDFERVTITVEDRGEATHEATHEANHEATHEANHEATHEAHPSRDQRAWTVPSLLDGSLALEMLPLGAALRSIRDLGGQISTEPTARGLRTALSFLARRGIAMPQPSHARMDRADACETGQIPAPPTRKVLIADDDAAVRAVFVAALEAVGDDVDTTNDPSSIAMRTDLGSFDVVILDAGGGGLDALRTLRARGDNTPVLVASGDEVDVGNDPQTAALVKPFPLDVLDRELARLARLRTRHRA
jgi:CheY-like chemotaxis protein